jgi:hypothetical protein
VRYVPFSKGDEEGRKYILALPITKKSVVIKA